MHVIYIEDSARPTNSEELRQNVFVFLCLHVGICGITLSCKFV